MRYLIPLASRDNLFPPEEYHFPKPLIEISGQPMIALIIQNIRRTDPKATFIFVILRDDSVRFSLRASLELLAGPDTKVVELTAPTMGAICSVLMAIDLIDDDEPLVICNGDQIINVNFRDAVATFTSRGSEAGVIVFDSVHPRWSYVRIDDVGNVSEAAEKRVVSRSAIAGYYYFRKGREFIAAAKSYLLNGQSMNGQYYLSQALNEIILNGATVGVVRIPESAYTSFYSPQRVEYYQQTTASGAEMADVGIKRLQVVIPMAGLGSRFSKEGYEKPKPFIDVAGKTMIERVMDNLNAENTNFVLVARDEHIDAEPQIVSKLSNDLQVKFSRINFVTDGPACTVLTARKHLRYNDELIIANCDQIVDFDIDDFVNDARRRGLAGSILVFQDKSMDPKWSFAKVNDQGLVDEVKEKVAISDLATVGIYYFARAGDFIDAAIDMMANSDRTNGEYYVCPVYNYLIRNGKNVGVFELAPGSMHGIGTPADLNTYLDHIAK